MTTCISGFSYHIWVTLFLPRAEEPGNVCTRDRRALQQLALDMHVTHSDPDPDVQY